MKSKCIVLDFDGTVVKHEFPKVGADIGAVPVLKKLVEEGHKLILFTMRSDVQAPTSSDPDIHCESGKYLTDAVDWFRSNGIPLYGIQTNPDQKSWTDSPKAYGHLIIDDAAICIPLVHSDHSRPYVDWQQLEKILIHEGYIKESIRVIISGSRKFCDYEFVDSKILELFRNGTFGNYKELEIVCGLSAGVDTLGAMFAKKYKLKINNFPPNWSLHGKAAGPIRNKQMAEYADHLVAFWDRESLGTKNMIEQMKKIGKPVEIVYINP